MRYALQNHNYPLDFVKNLVYDLLNPSKKLIKDI